MAILTSDVLKTVGDLEDYLRTFDRTTPIELDTDYGNMALCGVDLGDILLFEPRELEE